jgi:hypothetical protein
MIDKKAILWILFLWILFFIIVVLLISEIYPKTDNKISETVKTVTIEKEKCSSFKEQINFKHLELTPEQKQFRNKTFENNEILATEIVSIVNNMKYGEHIVLPYNKNEKAIEILKLNIVIFRIWKHNSFENKLTTYDLFKAVDLDKNGNLSLLKFYSELSKLF